MNINIFIKKLLQMITYDTKYLKKNKKLSLKSTTYLICIILKK